MDVNRLDSHALISEVACFLALALHTTLIVATAMTMAQMYVGVMLDTLVVETARMESGRQIGKLQVTTQITFAAGMQLHWHALCTRTRSPRPTTTLLAQAANKPDASLVTEFAPFDHRWALRYCSRRRPSAVRTSEQRSHLRGAWGGRTAPCTALARLGARAPSVTRRHQPIAACVCLHDGSRCVAHSAAAKRGLSTALRLRIRGRAPLYRCVQQLPAAADAALRGQHEFGFVCGACRRHRRFEQRSVGSH